LSDVVGTLEVEVRGKMIKVEVNDRGYFHAQLDGKNFGSSELEKLRVELVAHTRKVTVRVSVPVTILESGVLGRPLMAFPAVLTGIHAKTGELLYRRTDTGDTGTAHASNYMNERVLAPMSAVEREKFNALSKARRDAEDALDTFRKQHDFKPEKAVTDAIEKAKEETV